MQLREALHQGQADAHSALRAVEAVVRLREEVEDPGQRVRRDADPAVRHAYGHGPLLAREHDLYASAWRRVFDRVAQQVVEDLLQAHCVADHDDRHVFGRQREMELPLPGLDARLRHDPVQKRHNVDRLTLERDLSARDARHVEQIVHQP